MTHDEWTHIKLEGTDKEIALPALIADQAEVTALLKTGLRQALPEELERFESEHGI